MDAPGPPAFDLARLVAAARLVHPFPSLLDGAVVALIALVAGGSPPVALALGLSMTCLQFAIGTVNDIVDAPFDAGIRPGKPIPAGIVSPGRAFRWRCWPRWRASCSPWSVGRAWCCSPWSGLGIGLAYDLWAKGTTLSWLPLAVGVPLLPLYGWYGATGEIPGLFLVIVPAAANAGTALAISNAIVDMERDEAAGNRSIALALGPGRASGLVLVLHLVVAVLAVATTAVVGAPTGWVLAVLAAAFVPLGGAVLGIAAAAREATGLRELAFEVQAVGIGLLAVAWLCALSASQAPSGA